MASVLKKLKLLFLPKYRRIYAVTEGRYKGEWWVQVPRSRSIGHFSPGTPYKFFSLPDKYIRDVKVEDFNWGITNKVIEPVDVLSEPIYNVCLAEFNLKAYNE